MIRSLLLLVLGFCGGVLSAANPEELKLETVREAFAKRPPPSKRILVDFERWSPDDALKTEAGKIIADKTLHDAKKMLGEKPCERIVTGNLLTVSREVLYRINTLAMAWKITGEEKYARRGIEEMMSAAAFQDWHPKHFLDVGEMSMALSIGYACWDPLLTDAERKTIADALWHKGLLVSLKDNPESKRLQAGLWWIRNLNNWTPVCHAGLVAAALIAGDRDPDLASKVIHRAVVNVPVSMKASYFPNGSYPDGPGYWSYGTEFTCLLLGMLNHCFGTDFGLSELPGWSTTGTYVSAISAPTGLPYNYSDGGSAMYAGFAWFYLDYQYPGSVPLTPRNIENLRIGIQQGKLASLHFSRLLPLSLLWMRPQQTVKTPPLWYYSGEGSSMPLATFRSSWQDDAVYLGVKGGGAPCPHGHMDGGSFILEADGVRWALDLGMEPYYALEKRGLTLWKSSQESDRWKIFRIGPDSHNILRIDGAPQRAAGMGKISRVSETEAVLDLNELYPEAKSVERRAGLTKDGIFVQDTLTGLKAGAKVRFQFCTNADAEINGNTLILRESGKAMKVSAPGIQWESAPVSRWMQEWDSDNGTAKMVWFEVTAPADGTVSFAVEFVPGSVAKIQ